MNNRTRTKFAQSLLGKAFEKRTEKQVDVIKSLDLMQDKDIVSRKKNY